MDMLSGVEFALDREAFHSLLRRTITFVRQPGAGRWRGGRLATRWRIVLNNSCPRRQFLSENPNPCRLRTLSVSTRTVSAKDAGRRGRPGWAYKQTLNVYSLGDTIPFQVRATIAAATTEEGGNAAIFEGGE